MLCKKKKKCPLPNLNREKKKKFIRMTGYMSKQIVKSPGLILSLLIIFDCSQHTTQHFHRLCMSKMWITFNRFLSLKHHYQNFILASLTESSLKAFFIIQVAATDNVHISKKILMHICCDNDNYVGAHSLLTE